jgi:hypothetical protein
VRSRTQEMKSGDASLEGAELGKWCDVLGALRVSRKAGRLHIALLLARHCRHPDAQWLAALFPVGVAVTERRAANVILQEKTIASREPCTSRGCWTRWWGAWQC